MCDPANKGLQNAATETLMNNEQPNSDLMTSVCKTVFMDVVIPLL